MSINAFSPTFTYTPGKPPSSQDWQATSNYGDAEKMRTKAQNTSDFFARSDNQPQDLDTRAGYVRLQNVAAKGLLEESSLSVSGYRTPDGNLQATSTNENGSSSLLAISQEGKEVFMDRPVYVNNRYMPTLETLNKNGDGSYSYAAAYHEWIG